MIVIQNFCLVTSTHMRVEYRQYKIITHININAITKRIGFQLLKFCTTKLVWDF